MDYLTSFINLFSQVEIKGLEGPGVIIALILFVLLLIASGYMSSSEVAFFSLSPSDRDIIKEEEEEEDKTITDLLSRPEELLATILIGNNIVNVGIVMLSTYIVANIFNFSQAPILGFVLQTIVLTLILLLVGEIIPKVYAQISPLKIARFSAPKMKVIRVILKPMSKLLLKSMNLFSTTLISSTRQSDLSLDDLSKAVSLSTTASDDEEKTMISEIIKFYNKTASEIMVPRIDMIDIDSSWPFTKMLEFAVSSGYSRIPVYRETEDDILGLIYLKDLIPYKNNGDDFAWNSLIRPAYFVPENKKIDDLLEEFRANKIHMSIVVDEFGGTSGIITMEDILEEIVGEITDEYDEEELPYTRYADGSYLFEAKTSLTDVKRYLDLEDDVFDPAAEEVDTLGGLVLEIKQELPHPGDEVWYNGWHFIVISMDKRRILEVKIQQVHEEGAESDK